MHEIDVTRRYADLYSEKDVIAPRTPAFGVHSPDKHWVVATQPSLTKSYTEEKIDAFYRDRLRSLRSVDDIVAGAYGLLRDHGALNSTYFVFTSGASLHASVRAIVAHVCHVSLLTNLFTLHGACDRFSRDRSRFARGPVQLGPVQEAAVRV